MPLSEVKKIYKVVKEIGSGLNDNQKQLAIILVDPQYNILIVERQNRLAWFGIHCLEILLKELGKVLDIVENLEEKGDKLIKYLISIIISFIPISMD